MTDAGATDWGSLYFDHFERYLGRAKEHLVHRFIDDVGDVQAFCYDGVIADCWAIASLGLTKCAPRIGALCEVLCVVDSDHRIFAESLLYSMSTLATKGERFGWGMAVCGLSERLRSAGSKSGMDGFYFSRLANAPPEFAIVDGGGTKGAMYSAIPIRESEYQYFYKFGVERFEKALADSGVDIVQMSRPSIV